MGLGGAPPLLPLLPTDFGAEEAIPPVVSVLAAGPTGLVAGSLEKAILDAAGPGRILTGTLADSGSDNTIKLVTQQGVEITLARPPGLSIPLGSTISLRITTIGVSPQALVLTVNGRPFVYALTRSSDSPPAAQIAASQSPALLGSRLYTVLPTDQTAALATSVLVDLSRGPLASSNTLAIAGNPSGLAQTLVAMLVRTTGPSRSGSPVPTVGTRYRIAVLDVEPPPDVAESDSSPISTAQNSKANALAVVALAAPPQEEGPTPTAAEIAEAAATPVDPPQEGDQEEVPQAEPAFVAQDVEISGRVIDIETSANGASRTFVDTPLGTLSLPIADKTLAIGSTLQLKITHAAAPAGNATLAPLIGGETDPPLPPTPMEALDQTAQAAEPQLRQSALATLQHQLLLTPGPQLAAAMLEFIQPSGKADPRRSTSEATIKEALKSLGSTPALTQALASAAAAIGQAAAGQASTDWTITILPFIGAASIRPARFYSKAVNDGGSETEPSTHRFVLDIELKRLGPLQFDGLLKERRFDLMLRSRNRLDADLRSLVQRVFREAISVGGFSGEMGFGGLLSLAAQGSPKPPESHYIDA